MILIFACSLSSLNLLQNSGIVDSSQRLPIMSFPRRPCLAALSFAFLGFAGCQAKSPSAAQADASPAAQPSVATIVTPNQAAPAPTPGQEQKLQIAPLPPVQQADATSCKPVVEDTHALLKLLRDPALAKLSLADAQTRLDGFCIKLAPEGDVSQDAVLKGSAAQGTWTAIFVEFEGSGKDSQTLHRIIVHSAKDYRADLLQELVGAATDSLGKPDWTDGAGAALVGSGWTLKESGLELAISKENTGTIDIVLQIASEGE